MAKTMSSRWMRVIASVSLITLCLMGTFSISSAQAPGAICVLRLVAEGDVLGTLVDVPQNFNTAVLIPKGKDVKVPLLCDLVNTMGLAVANQKDKAVNFAVQVFANNGDLVCTKGPVLLQVNGGAGMTFADCQ